MPSERPAHFYLAEGITPPGYAYRSVLQNPQEMAIGPDGLLYVADWLGRHIVRVAPDGTMNAIETWRDPNFLGGGPRCVAFSPDGTLYSCDHGHIYRFGADGLIETSLALTEGTFIGSIAFSSSGELFYTDRNTGTVHHWNASGPPDTVATGIPNAEHMAFGRDGTLYVSQMSMNRVVQVNVTTGQVSDFLSGDLGNDPLFLAIDAQGDIWIHGTNTLVRLTPDGTRKPHTVAGEFPIYPPGGIVFDAHGNLWMGCYNSLLRRLDLTNPGEPDPSFKVTIVSPGFYATSLTLGLDGSLYAAESNSHRFLRINHEDEAETLAENLPFGNFALATDHLGKIYLGLPTGTIVFYEGDGVLSDFAAVPTFSMVFAEDENLYAIAGEFFQPKSLVRVSDAGQVTTLATAIDGIPFGTSQAHISRAPGGLYIFTEQDCNLFLTGLDGQGRLIANLTSVTGVCLPVAMASAPNGDIYYLAHGAYTLYRIDPQGNATEFAYSLLGDPWAMVVSPDGQWLYVAEAGAIDKFPLTEAVP